MPIADSLASRPDTSPHTLTAHKTSPFRIPRSQNSCPILFAQIPSHNNRVSTSHPSQISNLQSPKNPSHATHLQYLLNLTSVSTATHWRPSLPNNSTPHHKPNSHPPH